MNKTTTARMTQRFHAEAARKRIPPVALLLGGIGAVFLAVLAVILFWDTEDLAGLQYQAEQRILEARKLEEAGSLPEAMKAFEAALPFVEGREQLSGLERDIRLSLRNLKVQAADEADRLRRLARLEARSATCRPEEIAGLIVELEGLRAGAKQAEREKIDRIVAELKSKSAVQGVMDPARFRRDLAKHGDHWSRMISAWEEYIADPRASEDDREKARREVAHVQTLAREDLRNLRVRAEKLPRDEARALLQAGQPRFVKTSSAADLKKLLDGLK